MEHRIAYQGEEGCYSESEMFQLFGGSDVNGLPCDSFEVAFKSVVTGGDVTDADRELFGWKYL